MSLETAQKVIVPRKKNYVPHFLKQRDINSYKLPYCSKNVSLALLNGWNVTKFVAVKWEEDPDFLFRLFQIACKCYITTVFAC